MNHLTQMDAVGGVSDVKVFAPVIIQFIAHTLARREHAAFCLSPTPEPAAEKIVTKSVPRARPRRYLFICLSDCLLGFAIWINFLCSTRRTIYAGGRSECGAIGLRKSLDSLFLHTKQIVQLARNIPVVHFL
jgi:hypothetical protein